MIKRLLILLSIILTLISCNKKEITPAFYYWKTVYSISQKQNSLLDSLHVDKIYLRYFDLDKTKNSKNIIPRGKIIITQKANHKIVPVIYITNRSFINTSKKEINKTAKNTILLINSISGKLNIIPKEIQIDCDWTKSTKENYFYFLKIIKEESEIQCLSATIRLHQVKYPKLTGIPPIDKGMLMYYNMGKLSADPILNSIYNKHDAGNYNKYIEDYSLDLDFALPAFSWAIHSRDKKIINLYNGASPQKYINNDNIIRLREDLFEVEKSHSWQGQYFTKGDWIRFEFFTPKMALEAAIDLAELTSKQNRNISIYSLDSLNNSKYETQDFKSIFDSFR